MDSKQSAAEFNRRIGKRLAALRQARSMNQAEAAKLLGITQSGLSQYENGQRTISCSVAYELMKLYGASYEDVFGPAGEVTETTSDQGNEADQLLTLLAKSSGSAEIASAVEAYRLIAAYRMLRALYECNPHNSGSVFDAETEEAMRFTEQFLREEPQRLSSLIHAGTKVNRSRIELPVERSAELRRFIESCEAFFGQARTDQ